MCPKQRPRLAVRGREEARAGLFDVASGCVGGAGCVGPLEALCGLGALAQGQASARRGLFDNVCIGVGRVERRRSCQQRRRNCRQPDHHGGPRHAGPHHLVLDLGRQRRLVLRFEQRFLPCLQSSLHLCRRRLDLVGARAEFLRGQDSAPSGCRDPRPLIPTPTS